MEDFYLDEQSRCCQVNKEITICDGERSSTTNTGEHPIWSDCSARTSKAPTHGHPDFQMHNDMETDDIFLNSFVEEDPSNMEDALEPLQIFSDSLYGSSSFEDLMSSMICDPHSLAKDQHRRESSKCMNTSNFPLFMDDISDGWDNAEDGSVSCLVPDESKGSEGSPMYQDPNFTVLIPAVLNDANESEEVTDVEEPRCLEATVLLELEEVMIQLNERTRTCFRDAFYRLAKSSKQQHYTSRNVNAVCMDRPSFEQANDDSTRMGKTRCAESKTNVIDRTIANLLFNKAA